MRRIWSFRAGVALASLVACTSSGSGQSTDGATTAGVSEGPTGGQQPTGQGPTGGEPTTDDDPPGPTSSVDPTGSADPTGENPTTGSDTGNDPTGGGGLGPAEFDPDDLDAASHGGTITFQEIGAPGWYPSRRDPAVGPCDAYEVDGCCLAQHEVTGDQLTPWDEDLILTLRGPLQLKQFAAYQPASGDSGQWSLVSGWDERWPAEGQGLAFKGNDTESEGFAGIVGTECLVNVSTATPFACGDGSSPFCPAGDDAEYHGWAGSKLFVLLARMPDAGVVGEPCSDNADGNWYNAPWIGLSLGELVRAGSFSNCQCYAKNPDEWYLGDGCGQFNVFEVVNDNNQYQNFGVFSTNFFGYAGYVGEGPCGDQCDVSQLAPEVDLVDKGENVEAAQGAVATPDGGPGAAFRRPFDGYRYFIILLDTSSRTVQLAIVHPDQVPAALAPLLPGLPGSIAQTTVEDALGLRLPK
ncbi:DUF2403 domain-containing lipoprotein [Nannocystis radixulma]|uniref:DUF2403 domain-containing lipoprotein n=1 Tax=Nannocystis radixulma TaxID=2995305 RepID=A0ABT5BGT6_9BACT|nr:DUF2403 domain-containing lipoprotein [Nannocystis radixulma]MDC0672918.1 DUF2403 domain-containing lipoprotein [Nannocystis radixulma]